MQIGILEPNNFSIIALEKLRERGKVSFFEGKNLQTFIKDKEVLFIRLKYYIGKDFLRYARRLEYICSPTTGLNHIDLNETEKKGIEVLSLRGEEDFLSTIRATPEHTFGLVLVLLRNYKYSFLNPHNYEWDRDKYIGSEIYNNSIGIIGLGRVGKLLSQYLSCFGAKVFYYDINEKKSETDNAKRANSIEDLIKQSNIVILCASYNKHNENLIDKYYIDLLKGRYFINTARGELVNEEYLIEKIKESHFKGVALDVIKNETGNNNLDKLIGLVAEHNLIVTPHIGGATLGSMHKTEEFIADKLKRELEGK